MGCYASRGYLMEKYSLVERYMISIMASAEDGKITLSEHEWEVKCVINNMNAIIKELSE